MLIFTIILQWFSNDTAFNRKTPTILQKSPEKQSHQQNLHCAASYGLSHKSQHEKKRRIYRTQEVAVMLYMFQARYKTILNPSCQH